METTTGKALDAKPRVVPGDDEMDAVLDMIDEALYADKYGLTVLGGGGGGGGHHGGHQGGGMPYMNQGFTYPLWLESPSYFVDEPLATEEDFNQLTDSIADAVVKKVEKKTKGDKVSGEIVGTYDLGVQQKQMNTLKRITVGIARSLLSGGQKAIGFALAGAKQPWYKADLPGNTARAEVNGKLLWHLNALNAAGAATDFYAPGDDLKKWVLQAFIEANAVEEGNKTVSQAWDTMWTEIVQNIKDLPADIRKQASDAISWITGVPVWAWAVGGTVLAGVVGLGIYGIVKAAAPAATRAIVSRYLP